MDRVSGGKSKNFRVKIRKKIRPGTAFSQQIPELECLKGKEKLALIAHTGHSAVLQYSSKPVQQ
jgi:hypothetical protein